MSRYIERAEHTTRLLDVNLNLMLDESATSADRRWQRLLVELGSPKDVKWTGDPYELTQTALVRHRAERVDPLLHHLRAGELAPRPRADLHRAVAPAEQPLSAGHAAGDPAGHGLEAVMDRADQPTEFLQQVMEGVHQFQGVSDSTMSHGEGWQFIQVGRYIERAAATALLLEAYHEDLWSHPTASRGQRIPGVDGAAAQPPRRSRPTARSTRRTSRPTASSNFCCSTRSSRTRCASPSTPCSAHWRPSTAKAARAAPSRCAAWSGRLQSSLSYSSVDEILNGDIVAYLRGIQFQCRGIHEMIYQLYIDYSIQAALAG
jgi:uncharacterized alpha-E superfamily protein